jgi:dihydrofolate reductase
VPSFDSSLIKEKLIDEFYLFINPVAIGNGMTIFKDLNEIQKYTLIESKAFECGIVCSAMRHDNNDALLPLSTFND